MAPRPVPEHRELMTPVEVGEMFHVDPKTVARWAKQGQLTFTRTPGNHRRYFRDEVEALLRRDGK